METMQEWRARIKTDMIAEIGMIENYLENSRPSKTAEWGSGTFKKRKNKQYSNIYSTRISEMESRLESLKIKLNKMAQYRKKPVVIEARQLEFNTDTISELISWVGGECRRGPDGSIYIPTLEGQMTAVTGDYIIKGVAGEFYPCKPDIFEKTYEPVI